MCKNSSENINNVDKDYELDERTPEEKEYDYYMDYLHEIGIPIGPDGTPLGIGWDD